MKKKELDKVFEGGEGVSVIGPEAFFQGAVNAKGSIRIDGRMEGSISDATVVIIGEKGRIKGDVNADGIVIGGEVTGNLCAASFTELLATCAVKGDIRTGKIVIEEGAAFDGRCSMIKDAGKTAEPRPAKKDEEEDE
ncbi:MAG: polymer-forming cytoskeletal protein [Elusimicrobiaceae bacterium]